MLIPDSAGRRAEGMAETVAARAGAGAGGRQLRTEYPKRGAVGLTCSTLSLQCYQARGPSSFFEFEMLNEGILGSNGVG